MVYLGLQIMGDLLSSVNMALCCPHTQNLITLKYFTSETIFYMTINNIFINFPYIVICIFSLINTVLTW